jgi:hypothetical protein
VARTKKSKSNKIKKLSIEKFKNKIIQQSLENFCVSYLRSKFMEKITITKATESDLQEILNLQYLAFQFAKKLFKI